MHHGIQRTLAPRPALAATSGSAEGARLADGRAFLAVEVPSDAEIYVNGYKTKSEGSPRRYMSSGMIPGRSYQCQVQAVVEREGEKQAITKNVTLVAGSSATLKFEFAETVQPDAFATLHAKDETSVN
ncbi:MAG: TIGR03000 domain-containing protein [Fuerstiella sp.]|nr:TIGR03000 domain-containing protein [Fuerstiella sp.]MCP4854260.1 TIGR03000 domain-containing protein [Fuerstiella sp.]